jgi:nucleoside-diphosphate-sugar epimerase
MKTLFIGATGFIGRELAKQLKKEWGITFLHSGSNAKFNQDDEHILGNLEDPKTMKRISGEKFDRVIDASWLGLPDLTPQNNKRNLLVKQNLLSTLVRMGASEYIGFGSCLEYGTAKGSMKESFMGTNVGDFGKTKRTHLSLIQDSGLSYKWFRPFYLLGANQHQNSLLNSAVRSIQSDQEFSPRDPSASYDFMTIDQAVTAISAILEERETIGVFNIGSGETKSVNQIVNLVRESYGKPVIEIEPSEGMYAGLDKIQPYINDNKSNSLEDSIKTIIAEIRST